MDVLVGSPPQRQSVILDSGSSLLGFPCSDCGRYCGKHLDPALNVSLSETAEPYSCFDERCVLAGRQHNLCGSSGQSLNSCLYYQVYSEGSSIEGFYFSDKIGFAPDDAISDPEQKTKGDRDGSFRDGGEVRQIRYNHIGCHSRETILFTTQQANGILGVSFPKNGKQATLLDAMLGSMTENPKLFSLCAGEHGGELSVGGYNPALHVKSRAALGSAWKWRLRSSANALPKLIDDVVWVPLASDSSYSLAATRLLDHELRVIAQGNFGETLVDSGTTYSYFPPDLYDRIERYLVSDICHANNQKSASESAGLCITGTGDIICIHVPESLLAEIANSPPTDGGERMVEGGDYESLAGASRVSKLAYPLPLTSVGKTDAASSIFRRKTLDFLNARMPSMTLKFRNGAAIEWLPENYLFEKAPRVWCSAIEKNQRRQTILGMSFLKQKRVIFDRENNQIGFVSARCPLRYVENRKPLPLNLDDRRSIEQAAVPSPHQGEDNSDVRHVNDGEIREGGANGWGKRDGLGDGVIDVMKALGFADGISVMTQPLMPILTEDEARVPNAMTETGKSAFQVQVVDGIRATENVLPFLSKESLKLIEDVRGGKGLRDYDEDRVQEGADSLRNSPSGSRQDSAFDSDSKANSLAGLEKLTKDSDPLVAGGAMGLNGQNVQNGQNGENIESLRTGFGSDRLRFATPGLLAALISVSVVVSIVAMVFRNLRFSSRPATLGI